MYYLRRIFTYFLIAKHKVELILSVCDIVSLINLKWFYSGALLTVQLGLPKSVPPQYNALKDCSPDVLGARLRVLYHFSDLMYKSWRLLNLDPRSQVACLSCGPTYCVVAYETLSLWIIDGCDICPPVGACFTLQSGDLLDCAGATPGPAVPKSEHAALGQVHRKDHDTGQDLRTSNNRQENIC